LEFHLLTCWKTINRQDLNQISTKTISNMPDIWGALFVSFCGFVPL
jgi:hypothetical protein